MSDLQDMYVDAQERRSRIRGGRPVPLTLLPELATLLQRRPDLRGVGLTCLLEAVCA